MQSVSLMQEVSFEKFLSDVKLLLFGIDSDSFRYNTMVWISQKSRSIIFIFM